MTFYQICGLVWSRYWTSWPVEPALASYIRWDKYIKNFGREIDL